MTDWAAHAVSRLTLEEKVGQLIWTGVGEQRGRVEGMIAAGKVGAVILGPADLPGPEASARYINHLQELAPIPLLVASDGEHGMGQFVIGATDLPTNMALGAAASEELAYAAGCINAAESAAMGIHFPAPVVCDVNTNPDNPIINTRSFGDDPELVTRLAVAVARGIQEYADGPTRVAASAWHFPGHGDTFQDSHRELPVVRHGRERLEAVELKPFRAMVEAGVRIIGTAHVCYPALEPTPGLPATLSYAIMTDLLRQQMGFEGVVVSDSMSMWAIARNFPGELSVPMSVQAGNELVLADDPEATHAILLAAVKDGRVTPKRLDEAVGRVLALKQWLGLHHTALVDPTQTAQKVGTAENQAVALTIAREAVTVVKGTECIRQLRRDARVLLLTTPGARTTGIKANEALAGLFGRLCPHGQVLALEASPAPAQVEQALVLASEADLAVVATFARPIAYEKESTRVPPEQVSLIGRLARVVPTVVISYGSPYVLAEFAAAQALVCTYGDCDACLQAGIEAATGQIQAPGKLPVALRAREGM